MLGEIFGNNLIVAAELCDSIEEASPFEAEESSLFD